MDIIRKGQEEHDELMMAIKRKKELLNALAHPHHNNNNRVTMGGKTEDGEVQIGGVVIKNNKSRNLL